MLVQGQRLVVFWNMCYRLLLQDCAAGGGKLVQRTGPEVCNAYLKLSLNLFFIKFIILSGR